MRGVRRITALCAGEAMKKTVVWLLILALIGGFAWAEQDEARIQRHERMEEMFRAAIGTTFESEQALRADMTEEALAQRSAELAKYRADTVNWLLAAFCDLDLENTERIQAAWVRFQENECGRAWIQTLNQMGAANAADGMKISREIAAEWLAEIDFARLTAINGDFECWIYAPDSPIDYPVVHGADNAYWLHRLFDGSRNAAGTLFIDYRNLDGFQDPNTLIYGHHMRNDSMFGTLDHYTQSGYFDAHPWMLTIGRDEICLVEIIAGYTTSKRDHCYDIAISDENDQRAFIEEAKAKSDFESPIQPEPGDRLITLSTCAYAFENARYILIGRLVPAEQCAAEILNTEE